jgi:hypothetical protein
LGKVAFVNIAQIEFLSLFRVFTIIEARAQFFTGFEE